MRRKFTTRVALDAETANSELTEFQPAPATDGTPAANAIRPAGLHYDYTVDSWTAGRAPSRSSTASRKQLIAAGAAARRPD